MDSAVAVATENLIQGTYFRASLFHFRLNRSWRTLRGEFHFYSKHLNLMKCFSPGVWLWDWHQSWWIGVIRITLVTTSLSLYLTRTPLSSYRVLPITNCFQLMHSQCTSSISSCNIKARKLTTFLLRAFYGTLPEVSPNYYLYLCFPSSINKTWASFVLIWNLLTFPSTLWSVAWCRPGGISL